MSYSAHDTLIEPARASATLWRLAGGVILLVAAFLTANYLYFSTIAGLMSPRAWTRLTDDLATGASIGAVFAMLFGFLALILALKVTLGLVHGRGLRSLIGPARPALRQFWRVLAALVVLNAVLWLVPSPEGMSPYRNPQVPTALWLSLLPLAAGAVLVQIGAEELVFRGYLQSQLAARFRAPLIWIGLPTLVFGALHYDPASAGPNAAMTALLAGMFGLAAADLTARAGTLGPAFALHLANNVTALLLAAPQDQFHGLALFLHPFSVADPEAMRVWAPLDLAIILCSWLAARWSLRR